VWTDHSALTSIFQKDIQDIDNPRLRAFREKLMDMNIKAEHIKGKKNEAADALSRVPMWRESGVSDPSEKIFQVRRTLYRRWHGIQRKVRRINTSTGATATEAVRTVPPELNYAREDVQLKKMFKAVEEDEVYQSVVKRLRSGMTQEEVFKLPKGDPARIYREGWNKLTTVDDKPNSIMVVDNLRLVVPERCRPDILKALHLPHAGVNKTREMAKERYYWVGMNREIGNLVGACVSCTKRHNSKPNDPPAEARWSAKELEPMMSVSADHFSIGKRRYLILVDRYSSFPFVMEVSRMTTEESIEKLTGVFNTFGWPCNLRSDGGPAFRLEFAEWCKENGIKWEPSSSYYARSNGSCEVRVGTSKKTMIKCMEEGQDVARALAEYRNMPAKDGHTPSSMFFRRILRSPTMPALRRTYTDVDRERDEETRGSRHRDMLDKSRERFGNRKPRERLPVGTKVWMQDAKTGGTNLWDKQSVITEVRPSGSYKLVDENGTETIRNDKLVKPVYVKKAPSIKDISKTKQTWADVVKNANTMDVDGGRDEDCQPCNRKNVMTGANENTYDRQYGTSVDISDKTVEWNNMVENAAERVREAKKKKVSFSAEAKVTDGEGKMERRSERLKLKKKKVSDAERFVRRIEAKVEMTYGWFTYIPGEDGTGHWYENLQRG